MQEVEGRGLFSHITSAAAAAANTISMPMPYMIICMLHADTKIIAVMMQMNLVT
jgi:hypothetical protein